MILPRPTLLCLSYAKAKKGELLKKTHFGFLPFDLAQGRKGWGKTKWMAW
jgi:hypothetical protein